MKKLFFLLAFSLCFVLVLVSCSSRPRFPKSSSDSRKRVLCTIHMIADLTTQVAGDVVYVDTLIKKELDPHSYELVKGDDERLLEADLILYNGLGLEHQPSIYQHLKNHPNSHAVGDYVKEHYPQQILITNQVTDPHIWMDVSLWEKTVPYIVKQLSDILPEHKDVFAQNGEKLCQSMQDTHVKMVTLLQNIPEHKRYLITCHDAFNYFAKSYLANPEEAQSNSWRARFIAPEGLAPDCQLSTSDIQRVVDFIRKHDVKTIFPEYNVNLDSIQKIYDASIKSGLNVQISNAPLYGDSFSQNNEQNNYLDMIWHNALTIHQQLNEGP